ncbi:molybdenum cofactor guanylyltransferase MobA [Mixta theicola]|uniref:Molybdenum cofactor guanylyltransferase n=1 Tax=Mixta theicola TaxID=1458355 RepID=A0A2K1Q6N8_9GAMM|nr:molybdenum cofactor guanylyltransferase MobA [Mixta theicola]PNS10709.1 molybdenum cofactor guanylyltransferase MobA [Mixta theicola]
MSEQREIISGVILAGGRSSRMGGQDKAQLLLQGKPLWQHVWQRLAPQVQDVSISANRNLTLYQQSKLRTINDVLPDYPGPLAGMLSAFQQIDSPWLAFSACDTPFIPNDYVMRLWQQKRQAPAVWVRSHERDHPALALIHRQIMPELALYLASGERRVMYFLQQVGGHAVLFNDDEQAFVNINTPEELARYERNS